MDEVLFYVSAGDQSDTKKPAESFAYISSIHSSKQYETFRHAASPLNGTAISGVGLGERIFTSDNKKALVNVYTYGKESIDQRIPIPEALTALHIIHHPTLPHGAEAKGEEIENSLATHDKPNYRVPWLLCGGSKLGKLYIWELASGDLLCVKEAHYQGITRIDLSLCGTFLVTGGEDARIMVWNLADLIAIYGQAGLINETDSSSTVNRSGKPYYSITDNTLPITDFTLNQVGNLADLKLYTASKDSTVRIYDITTKQQLTTFILPQPVTCLARDPANRQLYAGLANGLIKTIPLYKFNQHTSVLEAVGGLDRIITVDQEDPNMLSTFVQHENHKVTKLCVSMDGTNLISGDDAGQVFVSDIATKQTIKSFPSLNFPISDLYVETVPVDLLVNDKIRTDKKHRMMPPLKRVLASADPVDHVLFMDIPQESVNTIISTKVHKDLDWLEKKKMEELLFKNLSDVNSTVKTIDTGANGGNNQQSTANLELKLSKVSEAYTDLRSKHEQLIKEHAKLLDKLAEGK